MSWRTRRRGSVGLQILDDHEVDVAVLDICLPDMSGLDVAERARSTHRDLGIVFFTGYEYRGSARPLRSQEGTVYLRKTARAAEIVAAVRAVARSGPSPTQFASVDVPAALSEREQEVLRLLVQGRGNAEIAEILTVSLRTAEFHVSNIMRKLSVYSRAEAVSKAMSSPELFIRHGT